MSFGTTVDYLRFPPSRLGSPHKCDYSRLGVGCRVGHTSSSQ